MYRPDSPQKILRMRDLPARVALRPSTIYQLVAEGKFPAPFKLVTGGRAAGWFESSIDAWLASRHPDQLKSWTTPIYAPRRISRGPVSPLATDDIQNQPTPRPAANPVAKLSSRQRIMGSVNERKTRKDSSTDAKGPAHEY